MEIKHYFIIPFLLFPLLIFCQDLKGDREIQINKIGTVFDDIPFSPTQINEDITPRIGLATEFNAITFAKINDDEFGLSVPAFFVPKLTIKAMNKYINTKLGFNLSFGYLPKFISESIDPELSLNHFNITIAFPLSVSRLNFNQLYFGIQPWYHYLKTNLNGSIYSIYRMDTFETKGSIIGNDFIFSHNKLNIAVQYTIFHRWVTTQFIARDQNTIDKINDFSFGHQLGVFWQINPKLNMGLGQIWMPQKSLMTKLHFSYRIKLK